MKLISQATPVGQTVGGWMHGALHAAALFCVSTFALSSFRASLNPETVFDLLEPKRIALILAGTAVFWLAIRRVDRRRADMRGLRRILKVALPGVAVLFVMALGWDLLLIHRTENVVARNLRWMLLWSGYFGTGVAAWLAVQYAAALAQAQAVQADDAPGASDIDDGFWVKTGRQTLWIAHDAVEWIEAEGNYARIHAQDSGHGLVRMTLAAIEAGLDQPDFVRIHRSALCRCSAIRGYRRKPSGAMLVLLASGDEAPLGRNYAKILMEQARTVPSPGEGAADDTVSRARADAQQR